MTAGRALAAAALLATTVPAGAAAAPTRSQTFFAERLLQERKVAPAVKELLRSGGGFVDRRIAFRDLTGDDRDDAVVRVNTGGADGVVAVYVLSTDVARPDGALRVVHRAQRLRRGWARAAGGVLSVRTSRYVTGEDPCCPSETIEREYRWVPDRHRFEVIPAAPRE